MGWEDDAVRGRGAVVAEAAVGGGAVEGHVEATAEAQRTQQAVLDSFDLAEDEPFLGEEATPADRHASPRGGDTGGKALHGALARAAARGLQLRRSSVLMQALSCGVMAAGLWCCVSCSALPAVRLALLTYSLWGLVEWGYHKEVMHAKPGSLARRFLRHHNVLHIQHHKHTNSDMTLHEEYDQHAVYFHTIVTVYTSVLGAVVLSGLIALLGIQGIPYAWTLLSTTAMAIVHGALWNTLHADSHGLGSLDFADGMPVMRSLPRNNWFTDWVVRNHSIHHLMRGVGNFNIVCPGWDLVLGTYYFTHQPSSIPVAVPA